MNGTLNASLCLSGLASRHWHFESDLASSTCRPYGFMEIGTPFSAGPSASGLFFFTFGELPSIP